MVQSLLQWIKDNIVTVLCIIVCLVSIGAFFWPVATMGQALTASMESQNATISQLRNFESQSVQIPPENPDNPNTRIDMPVTPPAIDRLKKVYNDLDREFKGIYKLAHDHNVAGHAPMLDGLFPKPVDRAKPFLAREEYVRSFYTLYAALNAGQRPTADEIKEAMAREETLLRQAFTLSPQAQLSETMKEDLAKKQAERILQLNRRAAQRIHMYATETKLQMARGGTWTPGPFQVGNWGRSESPKMHQIWEGQMQLWIQQDIVQALRIANEVTNDQTNVMSQPVKRLLAMYVEPGYVGIAGTGEGSQNSTTEFDPSASVRQPAVDPSNPDAAPAPIDPAAELKAYDETIGKKLPNNFVASPTGRQSNVIYDVRHAVLSVIVDSKKIPKLLNALGQVNYMTVFGMTITDVDDYAELAAGYNYGPGVDAVRLDLKIETIWLRSWTAGDVNPLQSRQAVPARPFNPGLMPDAIRQMLGLNLRSNTPEIDTTPAPGTPGTPGTPETPGTPQTPAPETPATSRHDEAPAAVGA